MALQSAKKFVLYTLATANGYKVSIFLEELKLAYPNAGIDYDYKSLNMAADVREQKQPWFLEVNPNGRIPALVHQKEDGSKFSVFESSAILLYLARLFDKENYFKFGNDIEEQSELTQWIFFSHGGIGPMQDQALHFLHWAPGGNEYATRRLLNETKRLYAVYDRRLTNREYLVGSGKGKFTLADINAFPWVKGWNRAAVGNLESQFPNLSAWLNRIEKRPGVQAGLQIPNPPPVLTDETLEKYAGLARKWSAL